MKSRLPQQSRHSDGSEPRDHLNCTPEVFARDETRVGLHLRQRLRRTSPTNRRCNRDESSPLGRPRVSEGEAPGSRAPDWWRG
ncbi:unnamed protein product [Protopolystoma xenopodis]|uniref:Uncharacterized protein n=1 Tax=Protopolystoma xenopodis TaxID=117903 RepID=A0A448WMR3_9PLAT|nr:unnamed protein product [Protopolystoma xenopodis]